MKKHEPMLAIFAVTFSLLVNEVLLSAIFSVLIGDYNTITAISVALLGLSSSGIVVYSLPRLRGTGPFTATAYRYLALFVVATVASIVVIMALPINHGDFSYAPTAATNAWKLAAYVTAIVPFFCGGLCISVLLAANAERIGYLYFSDLAGAAIGCLAAVALLGPLGAPEAIILSAVPAAAMVVWHAVRSRRTQPALLAAPAALVLVAVLQSAGAPLLDVKRFNTLGQVDRSQYRAFAASSKDLAYERWSLDAWTIIRKPEIPQQWERFRGWGVSDRYDGPIPELKLINYNLRYSTYVTRFDGDLDKIASWLDADLISLQYLLGRKFDKVLNIGAGGGREVLNALNHRATDITAVDVSEATVDELMKGHLRAFSGDLYFRPEVKAFADEGRSFVMRSDKRYDLIDFTIVGGTNLEKLDVIKVDDLFTTEALRSYLTHLDRDGIFSHVMYNTRSDLLEILRRKSLLSLPYIPSVKTLVGLRQIFESLAPGSRFSDHVLIASLHGVVKEDYDLVHIIVSVSPFSAEERRQFERLCDELNFVRLYPAHPQSRTLYADVVEAPTLRELESTLPFTINPSTDDRPFHYAFNPAALKTTGQWVQAIIANPLVANGLTFVGIAIVFLFGPLVLTMGTNGDAAPAAGLAYMLVYFAAIGCGYMLIEISLLLKLQLYLGKPVYTLGIALFAFLLSSGIGSMASSRLDLRNPTVPAAIAAAGILLYGSLLQWYWPAIQQATIAFDSLVRGVIVVIVVFPLAFLMGIFFPIGIRLTMDRHRPKIPWFWAVNGCLSIVGIFASRIIGLFWGFGAALTLGLALYVLTVACLARYSARAQPLPADAPA